MNAEPTGAGRSRTPATHGANGAPLLLAGAAGIALIALVDWKVQPNLSLGFLYVFPILLLASGLATVPLLGVAAGCAVLREVLSPLALEPGRGRGHSWRSPPFPAAA